MNNRALIKVIAHSFYSLLFVSICILLSPFKLAWAQAPMSPDDGLTALLAAARSDCGSNKGDLLNTVLCEKRIRFGVNPAYAGFSMRTSDDKWEGYEIDLAKKIAAKFGVEAVFLPVTGATRIGALADGRVDVVLATLGHTTQRESQVNFVKPHYYASMTAIVGERDLKIFDWDGLIGRTICVTVGSYQNAGLIGHGARLMLFDGSAKLEDALNSGVCELAAHDDSYLAGLYRKPAFDKKFDTKFSFAPVPWGAAVPKNNANDLALALGLSIQMMQRDGVLLDLARTHRISTKFLERTTETWNKNICNRSTGNTQPECVLSPLDTTLEATPFVDFIKQLEAWFSQFTGTDVSLPWLTTMSAWDLFKTGVIYTFLLVVGVLTATFIVACLVGWALSSPLRLVRWATRLGVVTLQSTPFVLALVIGLAFATAIATYSIALGVTVCIFVTGLMNGANAGQSISESVTSIIRERGDHPPGLFIEALRRSRIQLQAFLVNASKAVPAASFIGAPELLSSMTDISSFSNSRISTYVFLMLFYMVIVVTVVWLCGKGADWLQKDRTQAEGRHD